MERNEFMELVYETFADEPDNVLANGIIEAADAYAEHEKAQLSQEGTIKDAISRQAALEKVRAMQTYKLFMGDDMILVDKAEVQTELMMLPPAKPEPKEGHWIRRDCGLDVECKCSKCGYRDFVAPRDEYWFNRNFCPHCGARMKGERQK